jgi:hypothetical protein
MLTSGYQEGSFSSQINDFRIKVSQLVNENARLKGELQLLQQEISKLREQSKTDCLQHTYIEEQINETTSDNTTKTTKSKK